MLKNSKAIICTVILAFIILILVFPKVSGAGVIQGLIISANLVVPSLFPFMVCVLTIVKSGISVKNNFVNKLLYKFFGHNFNLFFVFILSMIGGYPVGARLIKELYNQDIIDENAANVMLTYCVNAGPAFIISIANKAFKSQKAGIILLIAHIFSSVIIALFCAKMLKKQNLNFKCHSNNTRTFSEIFVESISEASGSILGICSFVIMFSAINSYFDYFSSYLSIIKYITFFTEVTSATAKCKNIYLTSFLLGFSGVSIWCQVFAILSNIKINKLRFLYSKFLHGTISYIITKIIIKIFKIKIFTFSNNIAFENKMFYSNFSLFCSILIMMIVLLTFVYSKNNSRKIINDVV